MIILQNSPLSLEIYLALLVLASTTITIFFTWVFHRTSYKDEYFKALIKKRLESIEEVEGLLKLFKKLYSIDDQNYYYSIFKGFENFENFQEIFYKVNDNEPWLSWELILKFDEFNSFLANEVLIDFLEFTKKDGSEKDIITIGVKHYEKCDNFLVDVKSILFKELMELYDVRKFVKNKYFKKRDKGK